MKIRNLDHKNEWETPYYVYKPLDDEFNFDHDPCPIDYNIKKINGLTTNWGNSNFVNPGYSLELKEYFVLNGIQQMDYITTSVFVLPVSTSTILFQKTIFPIKPEIRFVKSRIQFIGTNNKGQKVNHHLKTMRGYTYGTNNEMIEYNGKLIPLHVKNSGQHDSMIVIFGKDYKNKITCCEFKK